MGISRNEALEYGRSDDLIGIGMEADAVRRRLHPEGTVSYVIDRAVRRSAADVGAKIAEAVEAGATGIVLGGPRGADTAGETLAWFEGLLGGIRGRFPALWIHGSSATDVVAMAARSGTTVAEALARLQGAGLGSLAGSDAGMLDDAVQATERRCSAEEWAAVHRTAHGLGLRSTAAMLFGAGETMGHRVNHLEVIGRLQAETGGFTAFVPVAFQPAAAGMRGFEEATAVEYLRTLAVSRMVLDGIANVEANWQRQGLKVLQMALRFGANDVGSVMPGESLMAADGADPTTEEDLRRVIRGAGFRPVQRDTLYRTMFIN